MKQPLTIEFAGQTYRFESEHDTEQAEAVRNVVVSEIEKVDKLDERLGLRLRQGK